MMFLDGFVDKELKTPPFSGSVADDKVEARGVAHLPRAPLGGCLVQYLKVHGWAENFHAPECFDEPLVNVALHEWGGAIAHRVSDKKEVRRPMGKRGEEDVHGIGETLFEAADGTCEHTSRHVFGHVVTLCS
uniref:Uncharacterized protein n=1 Tax=Chromera velia CCMP2878 TaxID=1169474 RepID=A0A0G4FCT1_9ALVE|eukprot:Cvel_16225.t1-p1 / transcript=Cvel_16225.t1 / gene=Cvel_16225 / organism=Chromera_velia_CCMP2878 / gene_product=hypothetical protein / transcript_product=hypothetical protein / location=Cvel_scaffold1240:21558-21950(-) / protein_length=131 / sequence_SO=supercontig / SO=protein_coding / is_pseudo=false